MKEDNKKEFKKNIITGVSTAAGAVLGTVIEDIAQPTLAGAKEAEEPVVLYVHADEKEQNNNTVSAKSSFLTGESNPTMGNEMKQYISVSEEQEPTATAEEEEIKIEVSETVENGELGDAIIYEEPLEDPEILLVDNDIDPEISRDDLIIEEPDIMVSDDLIAEYILEDEFVNSRADDYENSSTDPDWIPDYVNDANIDSFTNME